MFRWKNYVLRINCKFKGSHIFRYFDEYKKHEWDSREEIEKLKKERLSALLLYAYQHVPYYKKVLTDARVVDNQGLIHLENFNKIHFLTKEIIRKEGINLLSDEWKIRGAYKNSSGGSTGVPVDFYQDPEMWDRNMANKLFYAHINGKEPQEKECKLWGSERDIFTGSIGIKAKMQNYIYNRLLLNSFMMTQKQLFEYVDKLNAFKPKLLWAYVDSTYQLARFVKTNGLYIYNPAVIMLTAGTLHTQARDFVQSVFPKSSIINQYGSREVGDIACECPSHEGMHIFEYMQYLEVVDGKGNEVSDKVMGENIVTLLTNYSMPIIRYKIGDTSIKKFGWCSCGRKLRLLESVTGRVTDHFLLRDGTVIHGEYFTHLFYHKNWVEKFQVVQEDYDRIAVNIVLCKQEDKIEKEDIIHKIKLVMGRDCLVDFYFKNEIPTTPSGKYLYTISKLR